MGCNKKYILFVSSPNRSTFNCLPTMKTMLLLPAMIIASVVSAQLNPNFSPNHDVTMCGPGNVYFVCTSPAVPDNIQWDFGDGFSATGINPVHNYSAIGTYDVKMIVEKNGVKDSIVKQGFVQIRPAPESRFIQDSSQVAWHAFVRKFIFTGFSNADSISRFEWSVNGTAVAGGRTLTYTFPANNTYIISLKVTNNKGCSDEYTDSVTVADNPENPVAVGEIMEQHPFTVALAYDQTSLRISRSQFVDEHAVVTIRDISGRSIMSIPLASGTANASASLAELPNGTYIVGYASKSYVAAKRFSRIMQ